MATRTIRTEDAAAAAEIVRLVRARSEDLADPCLPATEIEVLVDMGARGRTPPGRARVAVAGGHVVGMGVVDAAPGLAEGILVGPVVHPAHRRHGHGAAMLEDLLAGAREAEVRRLRATVGERNAAARAFLERAGFALTARHARLRLARPGRLGTLPLEGIAIDRVAPDDAAAYAEFASAFVPRSPRLTEALVKSSDYIVLLATTEGEPVGCCEVDIRFGDAGSVEYLHAPAELIEQGLGPALLLESARRAFEGEDVRTLDLLVPADGPAGIEELARLGFTQQGEMHVFERSL